MSYGNACDVNETDLMEYLIEDDETDMVAAYIEGVKDGRKTRIDYFLWDDADRKNKHSSMMRVTGFPVAITARMLARGAIKEKGIVAPEDAFYGPLYQELMTELEKRNIRIVELQREI